MPEEKFAGRGVALFEEVLICVKVAQDLFAQLGNQSDLFGVNLTRILQSVQFVADADQVFDGWPHPAHLP